MGLWSLIKKSSRFVGEKLNLITDHKVKGDISDMSDEKLIAKQMSTRMAVASTTTGVVINTVLGFALPLFWIGAGVSAYQMGVSATNRHRVRREVKARKKKDPIFAQKLKEHDTPVRDIAIGCSLKAVLSAATIGIVGAEHIGSGFADFAAHHSMHHATQHIVTSSAGDLVGNAIATQTLNAPTGGEASLYPSGGNENYTGAGGHVNTEKIDPYEQRLMETHPHVAGINKATTSVFGGISDEISKAYSGHSHVDINNNTEPTELHDIYHKQWHQDHHGHIGKVLTRTVVTGLAGELLQPAAQATEMGLDLLRSISKKQKLAERTIWGLQNLRRDVNEKGVQKVATKNVNLISDLLNNKRFKQRQKEE